MVLGNKSFLPIIPRLDNEKIEKIEIIYGTKSIFRYLQIIIF